MKVTKGKKVKKINGKNTVSIIDVSFDDKYMIYVFQGSLSDNDILIKYSQEGKRIRTPKHIHWAVDLLLKMQADEDLTKSFIKCIKDEWKKSKPLISNDEIALTTLVGNYESITNVSQFEELNNYGEYNVEFLLVLMVLLMTQEKTNRSDAYMFGKVLDSLLEDKLDIFYIISSAGFGGRF